MSPTSNLFLSLGKEVEDEYGRRIGEVASFTVTPHGIIDSVYIKHNDGKILKYPASAVKVEESHVIFLSKTKIETAELCNQIPLVWRKDQALKELLEKKKISPEVYEDLHNNFEGALNKLKTEAQTLMEKIDGEIERCSQEIKELNYALSYLEVEHEIGGIDEPSYQAALSAVQDSLKKVDMEKKDLESMKNKLSNILLGETAQNFVEEPKVKASDSIPLSLPEPPVIVYVKETESQT
ncbi:MAG: CdvA-like protein [Candidatus Bathyarchaeia archaeon]